MRPARTLAAALAQGPVVLDGGLSNQLESQGCDLSDDLWSARLLADDPGQIQAAHTAYARAGAQVLTTAGYQATFEGFARRGLSHRETERLLTKSVELARAAGQLSAAHGPSGVEPHGQGGGAGGGVGWGRGEGEAPRSPAPPPAPWVAASVGPYGAFLADGSEYRGRYGLSVRELERFHRPRVEALVAAGPDVLALETVPDVDEAEALLRVVEGCGVPVWLSYTIAGEHTRAGQDLAAAFALVAGQDQVIAVGVNCCDPVEAGRAVPIATSVTGKPVVVYPNSGERWDALGRRWVGGATFEAARVAEWTAAGARLVGGCCRVGPALIAQVAARVRQWPG
ncbi:homocysteine S-methyltransferase [Streptomyces hundungensis]|uniref:homocysteine S-methyltransferase n=1 Tax=Streptomyces hundungensis TaxID=1077946 RepID=UPI000EAAA4DC|nr:homocysteine S-methyltransferase [Streptomyces hundungensis]